MIAHRNTSCRAWPTSGSTASTSLQHENDTGRFSSSAFIHPPFRGNGQLVFSQLRIMFWEREESRTVQGS
jgi:hypothetical protein